MLNCGFGQFLIVSADHTISVFNALTLNFEYVVLQNDSRISGILFDVIDNYLIVCSDALRMTIYNFDTMNRVYEYSKFLKPCSNIVLGRFRRTLVVSE